MKAKESSVIHGKMQGYVSYRQIEAFLKNAGYGNIHASVKRQPIPLDEIDYLYIMNPHAAHQNVGDKISASITFTSDDIPCSISYMYSSINDFGDLPYYCSVGVADMALVETTSVSMENRLCAKDLLENMIRHFGGGWMSSGNDDAPFARIAGEGSTVVTIEQIHETFGKHLILTGLAGGRELLLEGNQLYRNSKILVDDRIAEYASKHGKGL